MRIKGHTAYMTQAEFDALPKEWPQRVVQSSRWIGPSRFTGELSLYSGEHHPVVPANNFLGYSTVVRPIVIEEDPDQCGCGYFHDGHEGEE